MSRGLKNLGLAGLLAAAVLFAPAAQAAAPLSIPTLKTTTQTKRAALAHAERDVASLRDQQATLAHRINALKRLEANDKLSNTAELERLLSQSVEAERTLAARQRVVETKQKDLASWVRKATQQIDAAVKRNVPKMKSGPVKSRKKAARRIKALLAFRKQLDAQARSPAADNAAKWARYVDVRIDPLDGPGELADKADFVEDARDKFEKKRSAIREMLADARRERSIRRAASEFRADLALFDEESRSVRVTRGTTNVLAAQDASEAVNSPAPTRQGGTDAPPTEGGGNESFQGTPPPNSPTLTAGDDTTGFAEPTATPQLDGVKVGPTTGVPAAAPPPAASGGTTAPTIVRGMDAQALIELRTEELGSANLAPETLQRLLAELEALDRHLAAQAERLRKRARALEADEASARGMK